jgi:hypothetical protein
VKVWNNRMCYENSTGRSKCHFFIRTKNKIGNFVGTKKINKLKYQISSEIIQYNIFFHFLKIKTISFIFTNKILINIYFHLYVKILYYYRTTTSFILDSFVPAHFDSMFFIEYSFMRGLRNENCKCPMHIRCLMFLSDINMKLGFNWKKVGKDKFL